MMITQVMADSVGVVGVVWDPFYRPQTGRARLDLVSAKTPTYVAA